MQQKLNLRTLSHLALRLNFPEEEIKKLFSSPQYKPPRKTLKKDLSIRRLDVPAAKLKTLQKRIKENLLSAIRLPDAFHGAVRGRSAYTNAMQHLNKAVLFNIDLKGFFPSIKYPRVYKLFCELGCSPNIARILTRLTTKDGGLPQGAPTSSPLANLILKPLEKRIAGAVNKFNASHSIYVDDISISGPKKVAQLKGLIIKIIKQEGFRISENKIEIKYAHQKQQVTGYVVNEGTNNPRVSRDYYNEVRAIVYNCFRKGTNSQKKRFFDVYAKPLTKPRLRGKIDHIMNSDRRKGEKLLDQFSSIKW